MKWFKYGHKFYNLSNAITITFLTSDYGDDDNQLCFELILDYEHKSKRECITIHKFKEGVNLNKIEKTVNDYVFEFNELLRDRTIISHNDILKAKRER